MPQCLEVGIRMLSGPIWRGIPDALKGLQARLGDEKGDHRGRVLRHGHDYSRSWKSR